MCHQNCCCTDLSRDEEIIGDESLLIYCKPVMLYNILHTRSLYNPSFLRRCLSYKTNLSRKRRLRNSIVVFNYRDYNNMVQKTEVTEDFSCPFCSMQCISFKGLRYHLWSSHDLFNFEFWVTDEHKAVNVSLNFDRFETENFPEGVELRQKAFFFWQRRGRSRNPGRNETQVSVQFLKLESPAVIVKDINKGLLGTYDGDNWPKTNHSEKDMQNEKHDCGPELPNGVELLERVASSSNIHGATLAKVQSSADTDAKLLCSHDPALPSLHHVSKARKLATERSDTRNRLLLQKRQFYHSHRVQPMALAQVMSDFDSEDEVNDDISDFEDRRTKPIETKGLVITLSPMLDDFVDVSNDEKQFMHLWNSFVRKQRVLADGHVPWACEAFSKLHGPELVSSPALFWCWRLFMIKLWNHGLLHACTMNNCSTILKRYRNQGS